MTLCGATRLFGAVAILAFSALFAQAAPFMIIGNDEKLVYDEAGKIVLSPAGKDSVSIVDLANPENPKIVANLALKNSVSGPPMNLDIDPTGSVALVADAVDVTKDGDALKIVPDNKVYVIDLKANPPKLAATVTVGKQAQFQCCRQSSARYQSRRWHDQRALGQGHRREGTRYGCIGRQRHTCRLHPRWQAGHRSQVYNP